MTQMQKNTKTQKMQKTEKTNNKFFTKLKKKRKKEIFVFCFITFEPVQHLKMIV